METEITCPNCGNKVLLVQGTICPSCGADLAGAKPKEFPPTKKSSARLKLPPQNAGKDRNLRLLLIGLAALLLIVITAFIVIFFFVFRPSWNASQLAAQVATPASTEPRITSSPLVASDTPSPTPTLTITPLPTATHRLILGSIWKRPADAMWMVYIPQGTFQMGSDKGNDDEKPVHTVALDNYWIDQTEVTNAMFRLFVQATGYRTDAEKVGWSLAYQPDKNLLIAEKWIKVSGADWQHPHGPATNLDGLDVHPVVQMSWNDALAYCTWAGGRLPTEAEWEFAARGVDGRVYPWGNNLPDKKLANFGDVNLGAVWEDKIQDDGYQYTSPVGHYPAGVSPFGAYDMAGNASEWVHDLYDANYYSKSPPSNPQGAESGYLRVIRGGQWSFTADGLRSTARIAQLPIYSIDYSGFRCARSPE